MEKQRSAPASGILRGPGELRHKPQTAETGTYNGRSVLGARTIDLHATIAQDAGGRFFRLSAILDPASYSEAELDRLLAAPTAASPGIGVPAIKRRPRRAR